jgi:large subunit ribosomal protein L18
MVAINIRKKRIRYSILRNKGRHRLSVFRSNKHIYAQIIDDVSGLTLASASTGQVKLNGSGGIEAAKVIGKLIAENAGKVNVSRVVFDRGGRVYHGRIKALADAAREAGLVF